VTSRDTRRYAHYGEGPEPGERAFVLAGASPDPKLVDRRDRAADALLPLLRVKHGLAKARVLDIACARQHRLAQVLHTSGGPVYVAGSLHRLEQVRRESSAPTVVVEKRRRSRSSYVDLLEAPTSWHGAPDQLPAYCPCGARTLPLVWVVSEFAAAVTARRSTRLIAPSF